VRGKSLILNLPGSPKGAVESLESVIDHLPHALQLLSGQTEHR
jgi:molybdopterin biosynthesis enzyme MoaB